MKVVDKGGKRMKHDRCLNCFGNIEQEISWKDWWKQDALLCGQCKKQLKRIDLDTQLNGIPLHIIYEYNEALESMLFQFKEGRDIALAPVFLYEERKKLIDRYRHYHIVLLPSSEEKRKERGFQPVKEMLRNVSIPTLQPFYKLNNHKQSLQNFENRKLINQVIQRDPAIPLPQTPLLLFDDVCTSGSSLKRAYELIQEHTYKIEAFVLCAHPLFVESCDKKDLRHCDCFSILEHVARNGR